MALKIIVEDLETGEKGERTIEDGDYCLVTAAPAYLDSTTAYRTTHVLTVKGLSGRVSTQETKASA